LGLKDLLKRSSSVRAVVDQPAAHVKHFSGTASASGIEIDMATAFGGRNSDTIFVQSFGPSGIKVHLDSVNTDGDPLTIAEAISNGHSLVRAGLENSFNVARDKLVVSGTDDYLITVMRVH